MDTLGSGQGISGESVRPSDDGPFVHCFQTTNHHYVYDVNTSRILQVDRLVWELLQLDVGWSPLEELQKRLPQHAPETVAAATRRCQHLHDTLGVFSSVRPRRMRGVDPRGDARPVYEGGLQQLILELTQACNLRCRYCSYSEYYPRQRPYTSKSLAFATARKAIDHFLDHTGDTELPSIGFYGGEPLLRFDLLRQCVDYARSVRGDAPLAFTITTNGTVLTPEMVVYLASRSVTLLVSLDGPPSCHDANRVFPDGRPTSAQVFGALDMIKRVDGQYYREKVGIVSIIASNTDPEEYAEFIAAHGDLVANSVLMVNFVSEVATDYWKKNPPTLEWCQSLESLRWRYYKSIVLDNPPADRVLQSLFQLDLLKIYRRAIHKSLSESIGLNGCCVPGTRRLYVDCDGRYHMCERINNSLPIGDVDRGLDFDRITQLVDKYRSASEGECCKCWMVRLCSLCFVCCAKDGGFDPDEKRALCDAVREGFHHRLSEYCQIAEIDPAAFQYMDRITIK